MDLFDFPATIFSDDGRHGLDILARYQVQRKLSNNPNRVNPAALEYFDKLAAALLDAARTPGADINKVISDPALGLKYARSGAPPAAPSRDYLWAQVPTTRPRQAAVYRERLIGAGLTKTEANKIIFEEFGYDASAIAKHAKTFAVPARQACREDEFRRQCEENAIASNRADELEPTLASACREIDAAMPHTRIRLCRSRDGEDVDVPFPPSNQTARLQLSRLSDRRASWKVAWIALAEKFDVPIVETVQTFRGWRPTERLAFVEAALDHLERCRGGK